MAGVEHLPNNFEWDRKIKKVGNHWFRVLSWSQAYCLETINTVTVWLSWTSIIQHVFFSAVSASKKQPKQVGKMLEIQKNFNFQVMKTFFDNFGKCQKNPQVFKSQSQIFW